MTEGVLSLLVIVVLVGGALIALALVLGPEKLQARIFLPWNAGIYIDTSKPGWRRRTPRRRTRPERRESRAWLVAKILGHRDWEYPLNRTRHTYIGCGRNVDIMLRDSAADARNAVIFWHDGRYWVGNLSQSRGTRVNGQWIRKHRLGNGNKIRMGNTELIFREQR